MNMNPSPQSQLMPLANTKTKAIEVIRADVADIDFILRFIEKWGLDKSDYLTRSRVRTSTRNHHHYPRCKRK